MSAAKRKSVRFAPDVDKAGSSGPSEAAGPSEAGPPSKRPRKAAELTEEEAGMGALSVGDPSKADWESKHTLESDEEEEEKYERLDLDAIEGQEDGGGGDSDDDADFDGETKLTAFNMKEEAEDGHFDAAGNFIFNKDKEEVRDEWIDGIDWGKVKKDAGGQWAQREGSPSTSDGPAPAPLNRQQTFRAMLGLMRPGESVTRTLKRLGGAETAAEARKRRWEAKKAKVAVDEAPKPLDAFTGLLDGLVSDGLMEAYGFTYEKLAHELAQAEAAKTPGLPQDATEEDELDALGEGLDSEAGAKETKDPPKEAKAMEEGGATDAVRWEFKWTEGGELQGPCASAQMAEWKEAGYFKDGVQCRKAGLPDAPWYSSARIDFDIYD